MSIVSCYESSLRDDFIANHQYCFDRFEKLSYCRQPYYLEIIDFELAIVVDGTGGGNNTEDTSRFEASLIHHRWLDLPWTIFRDMQRIE